MKCLSMLGKKSVPHLEPDDPPRRRANRKRGHGTYANDRPPIVGTLGRESGQCRLRVYEDTKAKTLLGHIGRFTVAGSICYTDDWQCYDGITQMTRIHRIVCHKPGAYSLWALDNDGDGIRETHINGDEGSWTGLRNYLRIFRGVHKANLKYYVAMYEQTCHHKVINPELVQMLSGIFTIT